MRVKVDENLPTDLSEQLRAEGHDAMTVAEQGLSGTDDPQLSAIVSEEDRLIVTLDRGFGDVRHYPPGSHAGILVLRPSRQDIASVLALTDELLRSGPPLEQFAGCIAVVQPGGIRIRRPE